MLCVKRLNAPGCAVQPSCLVPETKILWNDWCASIKDNSSDISLSRLLDDLEPIEPIEGLFVVEWTGSGSDIEHLYRSLDTMHSLISRNAYGMTWPTNTSAFHLINGCRGRVAGERGYISKMVDNNLTVEQKPTQLGNGVEKEMNELVVEGKPNSSDPTPLELLPEEFVGTAAEVLSVMEWSLRGLSNSLPSDAHGRAILSFCFLALKPCNAKSYMRYMNYASFEEVKSDSERARLLMTENPDDLKLCRFLLSELSSLHLSKIQIPIDDVDLSAKLSTDPTSGQNVISLNEYKESLCENQIIRGVNDLLMKST